MDDVVNAKKMMDNVSAVQHRVPDKHSRSRRGRNAVNHAHQGTHEQQLANEQTIKHQPGCPK